MSQIGRQMRFAVANDSGLALPVGGLVVTFRRWRYSSGSLIWDSADQTSTVGASLASGSQAVGSSIDNTNAGDGWVGAQVLMAFPALTGTTSNPGNVAVYLQVSLDGSTWADTPNNKRGALLGAELYVGDVNPTARERAVLL